MARRISAIITFLTIIAVVLGTGWAVRRFHKPGQLDVVTAQAMDMSAMRPPSGAAPVALATVRRGSLDSAVTYTGSVQAYNEQDIAPRITGTITSLPVYPGDSVRAGQLLAQLDLSQVGPQAAQAASQAQAAQVAQQTASQVQVQSKEAALSQAQAQTEAVQQGVQDAQAQAQAAQDAIADAKGGVQSAQANVTYWKTEIVREKQLAEAGAVSQQEYQSEAAQAQAADAALSQAQAKASQATAMARSARAKVAQAHHQVAVAHAAERVAHADIAVASGQAAQAGSNAAAARAAARAATAQSGYARITSPANGVITERPVAPGTLVQPGTVILKVAEINRIRVQAHVAVADLGGIRVGTQVQITPQGDGGQSRTAQVSSIFPAANDQTRTAIVEAVIPNPGHSLLPGAFVTVRIAKPGAVDQILVPAEAVISEGGSSYIWLASGSAAAPTPMTYQCEKCHMIHSAADAKKNHYHDPMDGGKLRPVASPAPSAAGGLTAHRVSVQAGASDGIWTEIVGDDIPAGSQVVTHGQAGLVEGAALAPSAWGADGPKSLPTATAAAHGKMLYRCEKCGMTYSEADAKRNNFIDPMDGGKLIPMKGH